MAKPTWKRQALKFMKKHKDLKGFNGYIVYVKNFQDFIEKESVDNGRRKKNSWSAVHR